MCMYSADELHSALPLDLNSYPKHIEIFFMPSLPLLEIPFV